MYYFVMDKESGKPVDFNFKPVAEDKKAVFHSKEDALYFMDCNTREIAGADKIKETREKFSVCEQA